MVLNLNYCQPQGEILVCQCRCSLLVLVFNYEFGPQKHLQPPRSNIWLSCRKWQPLQNLKIASTKLMHIGKVMEIVLYFKRAVCVGQHKHIGINNISSTQSTVVHTSLSCKVYELRMSQVTQESAFAKTIQVHPCTWPHLLSCLGWFLPSAPLPVGSRCTWESLVQHFDPVVHQCCHCWSRWCGSEVFIQLYKLSMLLLCKVNEGGTRVNVTNSTKNIDRKKH